MKKAHFLGMAVLVAILLFGAGFAAAIDPIPMKSGFSGFIRPGAGYLKFKSNMVASFMGYKLSDRKTSSLTANPDDQDTVLINVPFALNYTFASTRTQLFLGTDLTDLIRFDMSQQFGVRQEIGRFGLLQGGILFSSIPAKVWKDPYLVNQKRDETSRSSNGARLVWDRIFNTGLRFQFTYRNVDVSSEKSGDSLSSLSNSQRKLLKRDGDRYIGDIAYAFTFAEKHVLAPAFIYSKDDLDGDAMSSDTYDFQVTYAYFGDPITITANAFVGVADYDEKNPIYGKTQDDDRFGVNAVIYYKNPWGWRLFGSQPINFFVNGVYSDVDANIDFYNQEAIMVSTGVLFRW